MYPREVRKVDGSYQNVIIDKIEGDEDPILEALKIVVGSASTERQRYTASPPAPFRMIDSVRLVLSRSRPSRAGGNIVHLNEANRCYTAHSQLPQSASLQIVFQNLTKLSHNRVFVFASSELHLATATISISARKWLRLKNDFESARNCSR